MASNKKNIINRRLFLGRGGAALAAATAATQSHATKAEDGVSSHEELVKAPAVHKHVVRAAIKGPWTDNPTGLRDIVDQLSECVRTLTDDQLILTVTSTTDTQVEDADLTLRPENCNVQDHPAFAYFGGLPIRYAFGSQHLDSWLNVGGGQSAWDELAANFDEKPFLAGHLGEHPGLWSRVPIRQLDDLKSSNIATLGLGADVLRAIGSNSQPLETNNLASGTFEKSIGAVEYGGTYFNHMLGVHKDFKHIATGGIHLGGMAISLRIKLAFWNKLQPSHQLALGTAANKTFKNSVVENQAHANLMQAGLQRYDGVKFAPFHANLRATLGKVSETIVAQAAGTDAMARRIDASYMAFRRSISAKSPLM